MLETLRIYGILLHKNLRRLKRNYLELIFLEVAIPILIFAFIWGFVSSRSCWRSTNVRTGYNRTAQSLTELVNVATNYGKANKLILYAPKNTFTNELMANVNECFKRKTNITGFTSERELVELYHLKNLAGSVVIFDESIDKSTKRFSYKLRSENPSVPLYNNRGQLINMADHYIMREPHLSQMQICLDRSFVNVKSGKKPIPEMYVQQLPYPEDIKRIPFDDSFRMVYHVLLIIVFMFALLIEIVEVAHEKFTGVLVLLSRNGISNSLYLFSLITSGLLRLSVFLGIPILMFLIFSSKNELPFMHYGNPLILYLLLIFYLAHSYTFNIQVSANIPKTEDNVNSEIFSHSLRSVYGYFFGSYVPFVVMGLGVSSVSMWYKGIPDNIRPITPYLGIIFPNILFLQAMEEIRSYENRAEGIQWHNLYLNANPTSKGGCSIGMILIFFMIGAIFHFTFAIYIYAIYPGEYGVAKHPLYFLNWFKFKNKGNSLDRVESLKYEDTSDEFIEPTPDEVYIPVIQIRNLKKIYKFGLCNRQRVNALQGVSIDFYKGQTTLLFGDNGSGKTTLMSILTGTISPSEGTVLIDSKNFKADASEIMKDMGVCGQENLYFFDLTVSEQIVFLARVKDKSKSRSSVERDVKALLQKFKLYNKRDALPHTLSGGQTRRLCLIMALIGDSSILILDEPTVGLDPESRRVIRNILLEMKGQKTILISTHDMEEADILGDRVAILHEGRLKSYGTSLFLKRLIGQNNVEVICSIEPLSDPEKIRTELHKDGVITSVETNKIIFSIPYSPGLPDSLDNLENKKRELGVTGFSVSFMTLEQVFLKMTEESVGPSESSQTSDNEEAKLTGRALYMQTWRALLSKKLTYTLKDYSLIIIKILTIIIPLLTYAIFVKLVYATDPEKNVPINLGLYSESDVLYKSYDRNLSDRYKTVSQNLGGNPIVVTNSSLNSALSHRAKANPDLYNNRLIAAAEFNESSVTAFYSNVTSFSLPISINLIWNTIAKNILGDDYSISLSSHSLSSATVPYKNASEMFIWTTGTIIALQGSVTIVMFLVHPLRESKTGIKQLQRMSGASGFAYWCTMFLVDFLEYAMLIFIEIVFLICIRLQPYGLTEISIQVLSFVLFGINGLLFTYSDSFLQGPNHVLYTLWVTLHIVIVDSSDSRPRPDCSNRTYIYGWWWVYVDMLVPYVSFAHNQRSFFEIAYTNARCLKLPNDFYDTRCNDNKSLDICCNLDCYDGKCANPKGYFDGDDGYVSLKTTVIYLCLTPILWLLFLEVVTNREWKCKKEKYRIVESSGDEQVQREQSMISERIKELREHESEENDSDPQASLDELEENDSNPQASFLVYELKRCYEKVKAVKGISFKVNPGESFGLLGVNGAGKSAVFRAMTIAEIPLSGTMYLGEKNFEDNKKYCLSQMGYCPQNNALLGHLNTYDHLRLFARIRGTPESEVENEVQTWIERLDLGFCASRPSGTYSDGNKRRLSIAITLIGDPNLILMDDPTAALDPRAKRMLWSYLKSRQTAGKTIVFTSHSMEECEVLCDRMAVMVDGKLACIGSSEDLKQRFGGGYEIQIKLNSEKATTQLDGIKSDMSRMLNCTLSDENLSYLKYYVAPVGTTWRKMYDVMNGMKSKYDCIDDFSVLSSSLEQLFSSFGRTDGSRIV